jgi:amino-acid N-acetyltransferase
MSAASMWSAIASPAPVLVRRATASDQEAIRALVLNERLNPTGLHWPRFVVATIGARVVGAVQMRHHPDGSLELGSLVVAPSQRGRGIAGRMIERLLADHEGRVHMITPRAHAERYVRWGFRGTTARRAPRSVRRNYRLGSLVGWLAAPLRGRLPRRLVVLERDVA